MTRKLKPSDQPAEPTQPTKQAPKKDYYFSISGGLKDKKISIHLSACFDNDDDNKFTKIAINLMNNLADTLDSLANQEEDDDGIDCDVEFYSNIYSSKEILKK